MRGVAYVAAQRQSDSVYLLEMINLQSFLPAYAIQRHECGVVQIVEKMAIRQVPKSMTLRRLGLKMQHASLRAHEGSFIHFRTV